MRCIIAGGREIEDDEVLMEALAACPFTNQITEVVSGCARGVDTLGSRWAYFKNIPVKRMPARWEKYGKAAGPIRNAEMVEYAASCPQGGALIAIPGKGKGTWNTITLAETRGLTVFVWCVSPENEQRFANMVVNQIARRQNEQPSLPFAGSFL
jgi:hypothetical protein